MTSLDLFRLDGQAAVVVGGAGGLGAAMARGLAEAGAAVAVADTSAGAAQWPTTSRRRAAAPSR
ncbi:MAG TPA: SDR family NAD(P)-dependent oxidoreductase [Methylomirabilota bacterium]|nr:SDR family NAD(P)-dependent oxidoreductase [Methylomirabilota bacterium]